MPKCSCSICKCHIHSVTSICPTCSMIKIEEYMTKHNIREMDIEDIAKCMGCTVPIVRRRLKSSKKFISKIGSGSIMIMKQTDDDNGK